MITNKFSSILFDNTFTETLDLLTKAERFLKNYSDHRSQRMSEIKDLNVNCEMTRVTARLTQVMAWILAQKASIAGEITNQEACSEKYLIKKDPFCLSDNTQTETKSLPLPVKELLVNSLGLYKRISSLSQQMNRKTIFSGKNLKTLS